VRPTPARPNAVSVTRLDQRVRKHSFGVSGDRGDAGGSGVDFTVNIAILADVGNGFEAINDIHVTGGSTGSSVSGAFYVPEPSVLMLLGLAGMRAWRRGRCG